MYERKNVIVHAPVFSLAGYGKMSQDYVMSLFNTGKFNVSIVPFLWGGSSLWQASKEIDDALIFMTNNRISDGSDFTFIKIGVPHEFKRISKTCNIGITAGLEVEQYPKAWGEYCNQMSAIIVPTTFIRDRLIACGTTVPIYVVPWGVNTQVFNSKPLQEDTPSALVQMLDQLPTSFNFLTVGQWLPGGVGDDRKNIPATVMSVINALAEHKEVGVIVKTNITNNSSPDRYALQERSKVVFNITEGKGRIHVLHGILSDDEMKQLYTHPKVKAFISLTHGEGHFRPLQEAMACDLPALVTGWSGHMDFVKTDLVTTIGFDLGQVPETSWQPNLLGQGQTWANPVYAEAENRIRRCYNGYSVAKERAVKMGEVLRNDFSSEIMEKKLTEAMDQILNTTDVNMAVSSERLII